MDYSGYRHILFERREPVAIHFTKRALNQWMYQAGPIFDHSLALEMLGFFFGDLMAGVGGLREKRRPDYPSRRSGS